MLRFIKTTVLGGLLFLVPIVIFIAVIGKALQVADKFATPIAALLGLEAIGGMPVATLVAIGIIVFICFIAGLAAKTPQAKKLVRSLEINVLEKIPVYELLKAKTHSALLFEDAGSMRTVTVKFDDSWQLAFEIERTPEGLVMLFLPGAPDPWSGSVCAVTEDRVSHLDIPVQSSVKLMKRLGRKWTATLTEEPGRS